MTGTEAGPDTAPEVAREAGLTVAELRRLARWLPAPVPLLGAGLAPQAQLARLAALQAAPGGGLILAVIPPEALSPPADPARLPGIHAANGAALAWLVRAAAPALAPRWRLNAVTGLDAAGDATGRAVLDWLHHASSTTGQLIRLDGTPPARGPVPPAA